MPCFDKKLEASRSDFYNDLYKTRDVDCVITSGEDQLDDECLPCTSRHETFVVFVVSIYLQNFIA